MPTPASETVAEGRARLTMPVSGMQCSLCTGIIERRLAELPGVEQVSVNLPDEQLLVDYDPERTGPEQLQAAVGELGFAVGDSAASRGGQESDEDAAKVVSEGRRLLILAALSVVTVPLMLLELTGVVGGWVGWPLGALAVVSLVVAPELFSDTLHSRRRGLLTNRPVVRASILGGLVGGLLGLALPLEDYPTGGYFAVTVLVATYHVFSMWLSLLVRTQSSHSVKKLMALQPDTARLVRDGLEGDVPIQALSVGDVVRVRPGERIPIDGRVFSGHSAVDESLVTGESVPVQKREGGEVIGGAINDSGTLLVEITHVGEDTFLRQIVHNIEEARALKPAVVDLVGRVLKVYIPTVLVLAGAAGLFWALGPLVLGETPELNRILFATLGVLIMAYPCAMGMAAPLGLVRGAGDAAEQGIVLRTGDAFQTFGQVRRVVFDKTGTLTEGVFTVRELDTSGDRDELLALAAAAEAPSEHPLGAAISAAARERGLALASAEEFEAIRGHGIRATIDGAAVLVGRPSFVADRAGGLGRFAERAEELEAAGRTVVAVARDEEVQGVIALGDEIRADAPAALEQLRRRGITPVMVTGDNHRAAVVVAEKLGIDEVRAEVLPQDKTEIVRELQQHGRVAMVGDGVNDAPALTQADVGIAMGSGTDIAIESGDVIIVGNRLDAVLTARTIGQRGYRRTVQNVTLAFLFNGIGVPLAATGLVEPIWAMAVMIVSVTAVFANSMRGKWSMMFSTLRDIITRQALTPAPTA
ncbi:cation-translocating P-type ATPase [Pseudonocardia sp. C8]|uniref:Heavy metal translocating P-type ATPase n=1 Tax=Saccharopolyspora cebuensis TaxID=418759 RepID=A0ABV4CRR1_9PSEU|nr:cation-translocating P-type ATPase [Pseudonocardia sp. C8]MBC3193988.1 cation-translocating P-type ATPase [Pseudonocardia sp. C8]